MKSSVFGTVGLHTNQGPVGVRCCWPVCALETEALYDPRDGPPTRRHLAAMAAPSRYAGFPALR